MFCKKCGTELPDNAAFCTTCGTPTAEAPAAAPETPAYTAPVYAAPAAPVKKKKTGLIIGIIAAVVVVIIAIVLAVALIGGESTGSSDDDRGSGSHSSVDRDDDGDDIDRVDEQPSAGGETSGTEAPDTGDEPAGPATESPAEPEPEPTSPATPPESGSSGSSGSHSGSSGTTTPSTGSSANRAKEEIVVGFWGGYAGSVGGEVIPLTSDEWFVEFYDDHSLLLCMGDTTDMDVGTWELASDADMADVDGYIVGAFVDVAGLEGIVLIEYSGDEYSTYNLYLSFGSGDDSILIAYDDSEDPHGTPSSSGGSTSSTAMALVVGRWDGVYLYSAADDSGFSLVGEGWYIILDDDYDTTFVMGDPSDPLTGDWEFISEDELASLDGDYLAGAYLTYGGLEGIMLLEYGDDGYEMSVVFDTGDDTLVLLLER